MTIVNDTLARLEGLYAQAERHIKKETAWA